MNYFRVKTIKHLLERKNVFLCLACLWTVFITVLCLVTFTNLPEVKISGADKYVHVTLYFVFTLLWSLHFIENNAKRNPYFEVLMASIIYGVIIEIAQETLTTTRHGDIKDVLANIFGSMLAVAVMFIGVQFSQKKI